MGWSYGVDKNGREIGYSVEDICNHPECNRQIDRGLSYRCGGVHSLHKDYGCEGYFCWKHLYFGKEDQLCKACQKLEPDDEEE